MSGRTLRRATGIGCIKGSQRRYRVTRALRARRNCNLDLNYVASNCPDILCEPQAGRAVSRNLQPERTIAVDGGRVGAGGGSDWGRGGLAMGDTVRGGARCWLW